MFERFTERARKVVVLAQEECRHFNHNYIGPEHLLLGLIREEKGVAARALGSLKVTLDEVREQVKSVVGYGEEGTDAQAPFTPHSKKVLELALRESLSLGHNYIGTEHLLLGLVGESEGAAAQVLSNLGADPDKVRREVARTLGGGRSQRGRGAERGEEAQTPPQPGEELTPREIEVLKRLVLGKTNREIAQDLVISVGTVKVHVERIMTKLGASDRTQVVVRAMELGLLPSVIRRATSGRTIEEWVGKRVNVAVTNLGNREPGRFDCTLEGVDDRGIVVSYEENAKKITRFYPWHSIVVITLGRRR